MRAFQRFLPCLVALALPLVSCTDANQSASQGAADGEVKQGATCEYLDADEPVKPVDPPESTNVPNVGTVDVTMRMTAGDVKLTLDQASAPCTVNSFLSLAEQGYFDDTICHRLVDHSIFILQCGDPSGTGKGGPGYTYADEVKDNATYESGVVAMANRGPDTNGSQFFIVWDDSALDPDYTVFGKVDDAGLDVIRGIAAQGVDASDSTSPIAEARIAEVIVG